MCRLADRGRWAVLIDNWQCFFDLWSNGGPGDPTATEAQEVPFGLLKRRDAACTCRWGHLRYLSSDSRHL
jgi:hypothetical protein